MKFNERLLELRKQKGWSQEELGYKINVSRQTISKWEAGQTTPELEKLRILAEIFEITVDELINGNEAIEENNIHLEKGSKICNRKKFKIILLSILAILVFYIVIIVFRLIVLNKINETILLEANGFFECYLDKRISAKENNINYQKQRTEYYYSNKYNDLENVVTHKIVFYEPGDMIDVEKEIYLDSQYNSVEKNKYNNVIEINLIDNTYEILNKYSFEDNINGIIAYEYSNYFNTLYGDGLLNYMKFNLPVAMDLRISISKTENGYLISNKEKNEIKREDYITVLIDKESKKVILEKTEFVDKDTSDFERTQYTLKYEKIINKEELTVPDLTNFILLEQ